MIAIRIGNFKEVNFEANMKNKKARIDIPFGRKPTFIFFKCWFFFENI